MAAVETSRVALIRYSALDGTQFVGSGLLVNDYSVLTADHVADGLNHQIDCLGRTYEVASVLRSGSPVVDLAVLILKEPIRDLAQLRCARIEQSQVGQIPHCVAIGFPRWKRNGNKRRAAQVDGVIPTGEGLEATTRDGLKLGLLTLIGNRRPPRPIDSGSIAEPGTTTAWGGMSGAVVVSDGFIIGVVHSTNLAVDGQSLTVTPLTAINDLPEVGDRKKFWTALGVADPDNLPVLTAEGQHQLRGNDQEYEYDVFLSYWPGGIIDSWVRNRFIIPFTKVLFEELGRQPSILVAEDVYEVDKAIAASRVLLAILSKQYFYQSDCRAVFESMIQRQAEERFSAGRQHTRLVHAIVAHDLLSDEAIPVEYRGKFEPINFKEWAYDFEIQNWEIHKSYSNAIGDLASAVAEAVVQAPSWRSGFPLREPVVANPPIQRKPTF